MYNKDWKEEYLKFCENTTNVQAMLNYVERFENEYGHDLYDMTAHEIVTVVSSYDSVRSAKRLKTEISRYLEYCRARGRVAVNVVKVIKSGDWNAIINNKKQEFYLSTEKYEEYLERIIQSDASYYDAAIFASIYHNIAGTTYSNLVTLRVRDMDANDNNSIRLADGRTVRCDDDLMNLLTRASLIGEIQEERKKVLAYSLFVDSVWRTPLEPTEVSLTRRFKYRFTKIKTLLNEPDMTYNSVCNSGIINRLKRWAKSQGYDFMTDINNPHTMEFWQKYGCWLESEGIKSSIQFKERCGTYFDRLI